MTQLGTVKTEFSRSYFYINPAPYEGPNTWRLSNIPPTEAPDTPALKDLYTLLPIDKTEIGSTYNLFFNIQGLPTTRDASKNSNYFSSILGTFLANSKGLPNNSSFIIKNLNGIDPIKTIVQEDVGIIYFDMSDLPTLDDARRRRLYNISPSTFKYNSRSVDVLTADAPLEAVTTSETAIVSLDFRNLPEA